MPVKQPRCVAQLAQTAARMLVFHQRVTALSATVGNLWSIMCRASAHDAQYAPGAILCALLMPRPPMRIGKEAMLPGSRNKLSMVCFIPSSCRWAYSADCGGNVRRMWWHLRPVRWSICHTAWRSGKNGIASHHLCSSLSRLLMTSSTNALEPTGVPNTFTPSGFHVGSQLSHSHETHGCTVPHSGLACV